MIVAKVVSGGQTGVDRAALDAAIAAGFVAGGWCPRGRRAEDGVIPVRYALLETTGSEYELRTRLNVRDSDATLVIVAGKPERGTLVTCEVARELRRPYHVAHPASSVQDAWRWLEAARPTVLNVAGPRESEHPGIYVLARRFLDALFADPSGSPRRQGACD